MNTESPFPAQPRSAEYFSARSIKQASLLAALTLAAALVLFAAAEARAVVLPDTSTTKSTMNEGPRNTYKEDTTPGGHGDYHALMTFDTSPDPADDFTYPMLERVKRIGGLLPEGMIANPAAIPWKDRCPKDVFMNQEIPNVNDDPSNPDPPKCPISSRIGQIGLSYLYTLDLGDFALPVPFQGTSDDNVGNVEGNTCTQDQIDNGGCDPDGNNSEAFSMLVPLYLLQTEHGAPAEVGVSPSFLPDAKAAHIITKVSPIMSGPNKGRLQWVSDNFPRYIPYTFYNQDTCGFDCPPGKSLEIKVQKFEMWLWGQLPKGDEQTTNPTHCFEPWNPTYFGLGYPYLQPECRTGKMFLTNPTSPGPLTSRFYARAQDDNSNADTDLLEQGTPNFVKLPDVVVPQDSSGPPPQLTTSANAVFTDTPRGDSPTLDVTVNNPGYASTDAIQGVDVPKKITAVLPDVVNVDIDEIGRLCEPAAFEARSCPENSQVGNVWIKTPLLPDGLRGDAVLVRQPAGSTTNLPRLGLIVHGDVPFNILSSTRYVGNGTQIETTFDEIPQIGFESLRLRIDGGTHGLLRNDTCAAGGKNLNDGGPTTFSITGYTGQTKTLSSQPYTPTSCFSRSVSFKSPRKCVRSKLTLAPQIASSKEVSKVTLSSKGSKTVTDKKSPFKPTLRIGKKVKKGKKTKFTLQVFFKKQNGTPVKSVKKTGTFKRCR